MAVFNGVMLALLVWVDFDMLIVSGMLIFNVTVVLLMAAYVVLKRRHPELDWLYGTNPVLAALLAAPPAAASVAMTVMDIVDDETLFGVPHVHLVVFVALVGLGAVARIRPQGHRQSHFGIGAECAIRFRPAVRGAGPVGRPPDLSRSGKPDPPLARLRAAA